MKILVVGSGGREHALCAAIRRSPLCTDLICAPGNAGIAAIADARPVAADDVPGLVALAASERVDLVVVGPEAPLVAGLADRLAERGIRAFGPSAAAARLEGSKGFMKDFCARHGVPTAAYGRFTDAGAAKDFVRAHGAPIVVKADGLAAGKGVVVAASIAEACAAVDMMMGERAFGAAGDSVVVEEFLEGEEASFFALCDGRTAVALGAAQDHKRVGDGDTGPNTGGMGAYSPAPAMDDAMTARVMGEIVEPTLAAMAARGTPFRGVLFAGLMLTADGPKLIEYNVRFGDPECQTLMPRLDCDLLDLMLATVEGRLAGMQPAWRREAALAVVVAAKGYPGAYRTGEPIKGIDAAEAVSGVKVFHAGTAMKEGRLVAAGGRVLSVTALGTAIAEAQERAYAAVAAIDWPGGFCRTDIGWRAVSR